MKCSVFLVNYGFLSISTLCAFVPGYGKKRMIIQSEGNTGGGGEEERVIQGFSVNFEMAIFFLVKRDLVTSL